MGRPVQAGPTSTQPTSLRQLISTKLEALASILILLSVSTSSSVSAFQQFHPWVSSRGPPTSTTSFPSSTTLLKDSLFSIESDNSGPGFGPVHRLIIHRLPGQKDDDLVFVEGGGVEETNGDATRGVVKQHPIVLETGRIGRQAAGAVTLTRGDTVLYATAARDDAPRDGLDFLPLSVEHQERFSSVGQTSGGYNKRDGRPAEHEVLTCRLIDRPLRPLIADGWRHETQLLSWVMSYDGVRSCDPLAIIASAAALYISDVPLTKAVAAAMVGYDRETDTLMLNPTTEEMNKSQLQLIVAGTKDAVLMIEGAADFLPEETMIRAVKFGHDAIRVICEAVEEFGKVVGKDKKFDTLVKAPDGLQERVDEFMTEKVDRMFELGGTKTTQGPVTKQLQRELIEILTAETEEQEYMAADIKNAFKDLLCRRMFVRAKETGKRCDGRNLDEIRELSMEAGFLPRVHGSALFTRGETQVVATSVSCRPEWKQDR
jgi:polyribonucleotide nucleotidyltransferase